MTIKEIIIALLVGLVESDDKELGLSKLFDQLNGPSTSKLVKNRTLTQHLIDCETF